MSIRTLDLGPWRATLHDGDPERCVVPLPGMRYGTQAPLLWFARAAARQQGWTALKVVALPGLDHWLEAPGDVAESLRALATVADAVAAFLARPEVSRPRRRP